MPQVNGTLTLHRRKRRRRRALVHRQADVGDDALAPLRVQQERAVPRGARVHPRRVAQRRQVRLAQCNANMFSMFPEVRGYQTLPPPSKSMLTTL